MEEKDHIARYLEDAEKLTQQILRKFDEIHDMKKHGPQREDDQIGHEQKLRAKQRRAVELLRRLQFLCWSSGKPRSGDGSGEPDKRVSEYLRDNREFREMVSFFFAQFVRPDKPPLEITVEVYKLFSLIVKTTEGQDFLTELDKNEFLARRRAVDGLWSDAKLDKQLHGSGGLAKAPLQNHARLLLWLSKYLSGLAVDEELQDRIGNSQKCLFSIIPVSTSEQSKWAYKMQV